MISPTSVFVPRSSFKNCEALLIDCSFPVMKAFSRMHRLLARFYLGVRGGATIGLRGIRSMCIFGSK